jgi:hypothetical protein
MTIRWACEEVSPRDFARAFLESALSAAMAVAYESEEVQAMTKAQRLKVKAMIEKEAARALKLWGFEAVEADLDVDGASR